MKQNEEYYTDFSQQPEDLRLAEHEWALSFNNDGGCYAFDEWFQSWGMDLYKAWVTESLDSLNEQYG